MTSADVSPRKAHDSADGSCVQIATIVAPDTILRWL
jgi:hypothetical protein